jgi:L-histidine N-alpha-methyltransferase
MNPGEPASSIRARSIGPTVEVDARLDFGPLRPPVPVAPVNGRCAPSIVRGRGTLDDRSLMMRELRAALLEPLASIPCKYLYDEVGSDLFDRITRLSEYYQTRVEETILERVAEPIVSALEPEELVELGSGVGRKIDILLDAMRRPDVRSRCVLFDISRSSLEKSLRHLAERADIEARGIEGDFTLGMDVLEPGSRRLMLLLGGTLGNLGPAEMVRFLTEVAGLLGADGAFLVGVDLVKDVRRLETAYNDVAGVTASFNRNILKVVNRRAGADFNTHAFEHVAFFDTMNQWIEMRLRARVPCDVNVRGAGVRLRFEPGQEIRTELSCKFSRASFEERLASTPLRLVRWDTDPLGWFALALLAPRS